MTIHCGDCLEVMKSIESDSIDLVITSPPYAQARKNTYGGIEPEKYVKWFEPRAVEIKRIMKPTGSFILNIKENLKNRERSLYVYDLVVFLKRELEFLWVEDYIWHKKNPVPCGDVKYHLKDGFERIYHFSKSMDYKFYRNNVKVKQNEENIKRYKKEKERYAGKPKNYTTGSKFNIKYETFYNEDGLMFPSNVLYEYAVSTNKGHPAPYPD